MEAESRQLTSYNFKLDAQVENPDSNFTFTFPCLTPWQIQLTLHPPKYTSFFLFSEQPWSTHHYSGINSYASFFIVFCCHYSPAVFHMSQERTLKTSNCSFSEYISSIYLSRHWERRQTRSVSLCSPTSCWRRQRTSQKSWAVISAGNEIEKVIAKRVVMSSFKRFISWTHQNYPVRCLSKSVLRFYILFCSLSNTNRRS